MFEEIATRTRRAGGDALSSLTGRRHRLTGRTITEAERSARWFATPGRCSRCSKTADGVLMSSSNERLGPYCHGCAQAILAAVKLTGA